MKPHSKLDTSLGAKAPRVDVKPAERRAIFRGWRHMDVPESPVEHGCESGRPLKIARSEGSRRPGDQ